MKRISISSMIKRHTQKFFFGLCLEAARMPCWTSCAMAFQWPFGLRMSLFRYTPWKKVACVSKLTDICWEKKGVQNNNAFLTKSFSALHRSVFVSNYLRYSQSSHLHLSCLHAPLQIFFWIQIAVNENLR